MTARSFGVTSIEFNAFYEPNPDNAFLVRSRKGRLDSLGRR
jgi:hypothetical protein